MNQARSLLILSSGQVSRNLVGELGPISTSNIPLPGGLFLDGLLNQTTKSYQRVYCTLDQSKAELGRILEAKYQNLTVHYGDFRLSIAETLLVFLNSLSGEISLLDVVYGDTFSTSLFVDNSESDLIFIANSDGSDEWDHVERNITGQLTFSDQNLEIQEFCMTGGFRIADSQVFIQALDESINNQKENVGAGRNSRDFHRALSIYETRRKKPFHLQLDLSWKDLGHRRTYFKQRRIYISNGTRVFNSLDFDLKAGWVTKGGLEEKIIAELNWFATIPNSLKHYVPNVKKLESLDKYAIQYIPSIPLNEHWISENPNKDFWIDLIASVDDMLKDFSVHSEVLPAEEIKRFKRSVYIEKVNDRYADVQGLIRKTQEEGKSALSAFNLESLTSKATERVIKAGEVVSGLGNWSVIHGDLCFSNIIYDQITDNPKLIDPRGAFGKIGIFGDPVYEMLKLSQCVLGDYDYLAANLYSIRSYSGEVQLDIPRTKEHDWFKSMFKEYLSDKLVEFGLDYNTFRTLEAGLFLSASPLHNESDRWLALILHANTILREIE